MANKTSAGLLLYRHGGAQVFLVHPGGPLWAERDAGAWSLPKGGVADGEQPLAAAKRELAEETGIEIVDAVFRPLRPVTQPSGKVIHAWLVERDCNPEQIRSNSFRMEWPPKSGTMREFPEVDRAAWFSIAEARLRMLPGQVNFIDQLIEMLGASEMSSRSATDPPKRSAG